MNGSGDPLFGHASEPSGGGTALAAPSACRATITLVAFDLGGVLVRHCRSWEDGVRAAGLELRVHDPHGDAHLDRVQLGLSLLCGLIELDEFCRRMAETTGGIYTASDVARVHAAWMGQPYAGAGRLVERVLAAGRADAAILSNMDREHWRRLTRGEHALEGVGAVRHRFASVELGLAKPMPGIYAEVERLTGRPGREILFLDDQEPNLAAAAARGWSTVHIDWTRETAPQIESALADHGVI